MPKLRMKIQIAKKSLKQGLISIILSPIYQWKPPLSDAFWGSFPKPPD